MKIIFVTVFLFLISFNVHSFCGIKSNSNNNIKIIFINGISNKITDACSSSQKIVDSINSESYSFSYFYNKSDVLVSDELELKEQARLSNVAFANLNFTVTDVYSDDLKKQLYYIELGKLYQAYITEQLSLPGSILDTVVGLVAKIKSELAKSSNAKLVLVAHSQGNFYVEAAYGVLLNEANANGVSAVNQLKTRIKVVGVASVAASTLNNRYLSHSNDKAVFVAQAALTTLLTSYKPLVSNAIACIFSPCNDSSGQSYSSLYYSAALDEGGNDLFLHNFQAVYMNPFFYDTDSGKSFPSIIAKHIFDSIKELEPSLYTLFNLIGTSADSSITLNSSAGAGGISGVHAFPNDAGIAFGVANYTQNGILKAGTFRLNAPNGTWTLIGNPSSSSNSWVMSANNYGEALVTTSSLSLMTPSSYSYVSRTGSVSSFAFQPFANMPSTLTPSGILDDGNIISIISNPIGYLGAVLIFDKNGNYLSGSYGGFSLYGFGKNGLVYGVDSNQNQLVFPTTSSTGLGGTLPCNAATGVASTPTELTQPATGRNCSYINAASSSDIVVGKYINADGTRGVFRFTKAGFEEIPISSSYFGYSVGGANSSPSVPKVLGVANDGTILLSAIYSDVGTQTCVGGPYLVSGTAIVDLKPYIPTKSCFNISAGISGGGRIYMSSQYQGLNFYLAKAQ